MPSGIVASSATRPTEIGPNPLLIRYRRPRALPSAVEPTEGHTVITVASATPGGTTPEIGCGTLGWIAVVVMRPMVTGPENKKTRQGSAEPWRVNVP